MAVNRQSVLLDPQATEAATARGNAKKDFSTLHTRRYSVLEKARRCAQLTIPGLLPPESHTEIDVLPTPYQSLGARGVNTLASKLLLSLLPPNTPFFKLEVSDKESMEIQKQVSELGEQEGKSFLATIDEGMARVERIITKEIEKDALRVPIFYALKLLIATGNALLYVPRKEEVKVYSFDKYVIERDMSGNPLRFIILEKTTPKALPEKSRETLSKEDLGKAEVEIFTYVVRNSNKGYDVWQELANGTVIDGTEGTYKEKDSPFIPLRWSAVTGEHYGRGLVDDYLGDLNSLEALSKSIVKMAAVSSKVLFLLSPNGTTKAKDLAGKESGDFAMGLMEDVDVLQVDKFNDFRVAFETKTKIEEALSLAFLLNVAVRRDAERVTAEEIRFVAQDLEDNLGGEYSVLSQGLQTPLLKALIKRYTSKGDLPSLPSGTIEPAIVTGLEALGRGHDYGKLKQFMGDLVAVGAQDRVNMSDLIARLGISLGLELEGLIKSDEQYQKEVQAAQQQEQAMMGGQMAADLVGKVAPTMIKEQGAPSG